MDFDVSKENIQPLRGGRNVSQLEVALQAQSDSELQRELIQQKESFEEAIRSYEGDDPLDNWYNYISWLEQSYPKHGHEGNLVPILEEGLAKFENDDRYIHDRRLCKLWIKYIDLQQDPLELFQLLHSKGICVSCADLYRAWAFYHEVAGDYKRADVVFQLGLRALAQPYEELVFAHENMFLAIGKQAIQGVDERRLVEQRQALTSLRTYKHKHRTVVPSMRTGHQVLHSTPGVLQSIASRKSRASNVPVGIFEEQGASGSTVNFSILEVARNQETVKKENTLKPGPWTTKKTGSLVTQHREPGFKVHEDDGSELLEKIWLPPNHAPMNLDDFTNWVIELYFPEPPDATKIPMYPKHLVYCEETTEYSPEEIRARKWFAKHCSLSIEPSINMQETMPEDTNIVTAANTNFVRQSLAHSTNVEFGATSRQSVLNHEPSAYNQEILMPNTNYYPRQSNISQSISNSDQSLCQNYPGQFASAAITSDSYLRNSIQNNQVLQEAAGGLKTGAEEFMSNSGVRQSYLPLGGNVEHYQIASMPVNDERMSLHQPHQWRNDVYCDPISSLLPSSQSSDKNEIFHSLSKESSKSEAASQPQQWSEEFAAKSLSNKNVPSNLLQPSSNSIINADNNCTFHTREVMKDVNDLWKDNLTTLQESTVEIPRPTMPKFQIHEDTEIIIEDLDRNQDDPFRQPATLNTNYHNLTNKIDENCCKNVNQQDNFAAPGMKAGFSSQFNIYEDGSPKAASAKDSLQYRKPAVASERLRTPLSSQALPEKVSSYSRKTLYPHVQGSDNFVHPHEIKKPAGFTVLEDNTAVTPVLNETCTTQTFNFNINAIQASTPFNYKKSVLQQYANATLYNKEHTETPKPQSKEILFDENVPEENKKREQWQPPPAEHEIPQEKLSVILETSKEYRSSSSSSSGGTTLKTTTFAIPESLKVIPEVSATEVMSDIQPNPIETNITAKDNVTQFSNTNHEKNDYNDLKDILRSDSSDESAEADVVPNFQVNYINFQFPKTSSYISTTIDLTEDDNSTSPKKHEFPIRFSQATNKDNQISVQKSIPKATFDSSVKNQYKDNFETSNDSMSGSPLKGFKMDVDTNLLSQNSNSEFKMDCDSYQEAPVGMGNAILQRPPSDPFSTELQNLLLDKLGFPGVKYLKTVIRVQMFPKISGKKEIVQISDRKYMVEKVLGKGAFGCVYKAVDLNTDERVALKYQKPPNKWEYYICKEIQSRISNRYMLNAFMDVTVCYYNNNGSILVSDLCKYGSLLDVANKVKQVTGKGVKELVAIYYANEIFTIINTLHQCQIIHADIKPDNFLVTRMPPEYGHPSLKLIDFGCSIDMSLFPKGTTFTKVVSTVDFICTEMKDGRPWTYQTDIFCIAATIHVLLFEKYMQLQKRGDVWSITQRIPRYMRTDFWNTFFYELLNIESCDKLPDLNLFKGSLESILSSQFEELQLDLRFVANTIIGK